MTKGDGTVEGTPEGKGTLGRALNQADAAHHVWTTLVWVVEAGVTIAGVVRSAGGPVQFLVEVGFYGFACYVAVWIVLPAVLFLLERLEQATGRETTDVAAGLIIGAAVLGGGALIRYVVFAPGLTQNLDAIGTAFGALIGLVVLLIPFVVLWYTSGSQPKRS